MVKSQKKRLSRRKDVRRMSVSLSASVRKKVITSRIAA